MLEVGAMAACTAPAGLPPKRKMMPAPAPGSTLEQGFVDSLAPATPPGNFNVVPPVISAPALDFGTMPSAQVPHGAGIAAGDFHEISIPYLPIFSKLHCFHDETHTMGSLSKDYRQFTKTKFQGQLSLVTENQVRSSGVQRCLMQFSKGELSSADGLGFVFSSTLPCPKNIQRIVSIFANRAGRICMRAHSKVKRLDICVKKLELGDWIEMTVDLCDQIARFTVWPRDGSRTSSACFAFGPTLSSLSGRAPTHASKWAVGYFACLIKNEGVMVTLGS